MNKENNNKSPNIPPLKYTKKCRIFWLPHKYNKQSIPTKGFQGNFTEKGIHEMGLTAFTGLTDFRWKLRQHHEQSYKCIKYRISLKNSKYSNISRKWDSWRRVENHQTNKGDYKQIIKTDKC